jgi:hypothetical protein
MLAIVVIVNRCPCIMSVTATIEAGSSTFGHRLPRDLCLSKNCSVTVCELRVIRGT